MKKKFVTFLLGIVIVFCTIGFSVCADNGEDIGSSSSDNSEISNSNQSSGDSIDSMTKEDWEQLAKTENFDNVTVAVWGAYVSGVAGETETIRDYLGEGTELCVLQFAEEQCYADMIIYQTKEFLDEEGFIVAKNLYVETALAMLKNFDDFTYNEESSTYIANKPISYKLTPYEGESSADIIATNAKVEILPDGYLGKISCDMKQKMGYFEVELKVVFTFSNYGTTILPVA